MRNGFGTLIQTVQNDYGYDISFLLQDSSGAVLDLSGAAVTFKAQLESDTTVQFSHGMTVTSASTGACKYSVRQTDFVIPGTWNVQVLVNYGSGTEIISFSGITVEVSAEIPIS